MAFGAANRDPRTFPDPDTPDPTRTNIGQHVSFGRGPRAFPTLRLAADVAETPHHLLRITPHIPVTR